LKVLEIQNNPAAFHQEKDTDVAQGKDATEEYEPIHPPDTLDKFLDHSKHLGDVDMNTVKQEVKEEDPDEKARQDRIARMPILEQCYNLMDFEAVARSVMKKTAWAYYSSGADDEIVSIPSLTRNLADIGRL
jgi:L-lactate dehydrogenase (cytochrome)